MLVDANVLLRVVDGPNHPQHKAAVEMLSGAIADRQTIRVIPGTLIEVAYVLSSGPAGYGYERSVIAQTLQHVLDDPHLSVDNSEVWRRALSLYTRYSIDLDDCYLASEAEHKGEIVLSFDSDFDDLRRDGLAI